MKNIHEDLKYKCHYYNPWVNFYLRWNKKITNFLMLIESMISWKRSSEYLPEEHKLSKLKLHVYQLYCIDIHTKVIKGKNTIYNQTKIIYSTKTAFVSQTTKPIKCLNHQSIKNDPMYAAKIFAKQFDTHTHTRARARTHSINSVYRISKWINC